MTNILIYVKICKKGADILDYREWLSNLCISEFGFAKTYTTYKKHYPIRNKSRHHHGFILTTEGTETYTFRDKKISSPPGTILYIPKGEAYTIELSDETNTVITMEFETDSESKMRPFIVRYGKITDIKNCFTEAEKICNSKKYGYGALYKSLFYRAVYLMLTYEDSYLTSDESSKINKAVEHLHANYLSQDFRISEMYEISGISSKYFETLFKKSFGRSPKEYLIDLRIDYAKELLCNEKCSVGEAALGSGYTDIYQFSKIFKSKTGLSPGKFRKAEEK